MVMPLAAQNVPQPAKLKGTPIGSRSIDYSTGRPSTTVNTPDCAFDGNLNTFYASYDRSRTWVGLDLGTAHVITRVGWCPRQGQASRVQLGIFEGSNSPDFLDAVPLYLIPGSGTNGRIDYADVHVTRGFRYVRYVGPNDVRCNIGELEFWGYEGAGKDSLWYQVTNLPTISIHTYAGTDPQDKVTEMQSNITITYDGGTRIQEAPITARGRGNASWGFPKKPYRIKFRDKSRRMLQGSAQESPAKAKKWTLINNYGDKTLMRNCLAFEVSRRVGAPYTPYCQPVDVILNGEYKGCYQLCDQITVDPKRVPITEMEMWDTAEPELTGGYLIEVDAYASQETSWFTSSRGIPVTIKSPQDDDITTEQSSYIRNYFNLMEKAAWASNYTDPNEGYRKYLDVQSFLKHFIIGEFSGNTDVYWSTYMYKDRLENQFHVAPSWDFDLAFDNDNRIYPVSNRRDWVYRSGGSTAGNMGALVSRLLSDPNTEKELKQLWKANRKAGLLDEQSLVAYVDSMSDAMDASQRLNFIRWPILNQPVHQNVSALGSFEAEVNVLRNYIPTRLNWIDDFLGVQGDITYEDSTYIITTPAELVAFSNDVAAGAQYSTAYLKADLDMSAFNADFTPIGTQRKPYRGAFYGEGHRISGLNISGVDFTGFFGVVGGGAVIQDLTLDASCSVSGTNYVGLIGGSTTVGTVTVSRVGNEADIKGTGANAAGIIGCNKGSLTTFVISDCYNAGNIVGGSESAAICGWLGTDATMRNCYNIGTVEGYNYRNDFYRGGCNAVNNYSTFGAQVTRVTADKVQNGYLCHALNDGVSLDPIWRQTLDKDAYPIFDPTHAIVLKDADGTYYNASGLAGDVNDNGRLEEEDALWLLRYLEGDAPQGFVLANADANLDGDINVADVVTIRRIAMNKPLGQQPLTARLYSSDASVKASGVRKVTVWFNASRTATAYEADILLSDGLSVSDGSIAFNSKLNTSSHTAHLVKHEGGVRIIVEAKENAGFAANTGTAFTFSLSADATFAGGTYQLCNQRILAADGVTVKPDDVTYKVTLAKTYVTAIMLQPDDIEMVANCDTMVQTTILPETATVKTLNWQTSNSKVATVADGVITAVGPGTAIITAVATDGSNIQTSARVYVYSDEDGLQALPATEEEEEIYDINGRRVKSILRTGIYIIGGKKRLVVVK